jgi:hypothetical protein
MRGGLNSEVQHLKWPKMANFCFGVMPPSTMLRLTTFVILVLKLIILSDFPMLNSKLQGLRRVKIVQHIRPLRRSAFPSHTSSPKLPLGSAAHSWSASTQAYNTLVAWTVALNGSAHPFSNHVRQVPHFACFGRHSSTHLRCSLP